MIGQRQNSLKKSPTTSRKENQHRKIEDQRNVKRDEEKEKSDRDRGKNTTRSVWRRRRSWRENIGRRRALKEEKIAVNDNVRPWALLGPWMCLRRVLILRRTICSTQRVNYGQSGRRENRRSSNNDGPLLRRPLCISKSREFREFAQRVLIRSASRFGDQFSPELAEPSSSCNDDPLLKFHYSSPGLPLSLRTTFLFLFLRESNESSLMEFRSFKIFLDKGVDGSRTPGASCEEKNF